MLGACAVRHYELADTHELVNCTFTQQGPGETMSNQVTFKQALNQKVRSQQDEGHAWFSVGLEN